MKKLVILLLLVFSAYMLPQQELFPETEIIFHTFGSTGNTTTTFVVRPVLCYDYPTAIYSQVSSKQCFVAIKLLPVQEISLVGNVSCRNSGLEYIFANEGLFAYTTCNSTSELGPFANALYEITIKVNGDERFRFLLDTRHNSLPNSGCFHDCSGNDISIVYNIGSNSVGHVDGFWNGNPDELSPILINKYYTWGEIRNNCPSDFSYFNELNMPILQEPALQGNSPLLTWIKPRNLNENTFYQYELQRSINGSSFITIFTSSDINTTTYWDQEILWNPNLTQTNIKYRVLALFDIYLYDMIIDVSNYQEITTSKWYIYKNNLSTGIKKLHLSENYPDPFNPTTKIDFQIPEGGLVELKVYDMLGNEIKTLLNEYLNSGSYTLDFNATDLSSGIYLYKLNYKEYSITKQMVLIK
ncbi:MAG TPA: T9SS type A sorting domain-containing protein [Ignavibacteriaceae bacterium]|nr:T9SS type A sorting domain-containing protein [Ignavibacteriaceae bacterium]